ncbi:QsdR family transcriptional regulator [Pseudonocardia humida]|uniref:TetR/AcrR family transcriptional regulator n=1 Tax=Pseudonocardia humida TaxID=2800819 RepID=A0ABT1A0L6_9PSEU|nr:QsdR family transcriptional regulator [Pseudonocardia humida]MCO1656551.1 TetR/AcrR family transcriptional regulator [Pseudonocardia humida]
MTRSEATPLQRQLAGAAPARPTALDAFALARRAFLKGCRIDMGVLARELGVNRATLYRWVGSRDKLLVEVIWYLMRRTADRVIAEDDGPPGGRAARIVESLLHAVIGNRGMQQFIESEGELALRLLTTKASDYQARLVGLAHGLITDDLERGCLRTDVPADDLAFAVVRIMESHVYIGLITGERPDPERATRVVRALLPPAPPAP